MLAWPNISSIHTSAILIMNDTPIRSFEVNINLHLSMIRILWISALLSEHLHSPFPLHFISLIIMVFPYFVPGSAMKSHCLAKSRNGIFTWTILTISSLVDSNPHSHEQSLAPGSYIAISATTSSGTVTVMLYSSVNEEKRLLSLSPGQSQEDMGGLLTKTDLGIWPDGTVLRLILP
jgi:hypothetical protein